MAVASHPGPAGSRRGLPRPPLRRRQLVRHPRQEGHHHAEGHPAGETDTRGLGRRRSMIPPLHGKEVEQQRRMKWRFLSAGGGVPGVRTMVLIRKSVPQTLHCARYLEAFISGISIALPLCCPFLSNTSCSEASQHAYYRRSVLLVERLQSHAPEPRGPAPSQIGDCGHVSLAVFSS